MNTYVYGFTRSTHPLCVDGMHGVGPDTRPLRVVRSNGLAAVVSDAPADLRATRRDLEAHQTVLEALCSGGTVLPMRFGTVATDDGAVESTLASESAHFSEVLSRLDGHREMNIKALHREDAVLRELLLGDRDLRERNAALRRVGGGRHQDRVEFGERIAAALQQRQAQDAERVVTALRQHAADVCLGPPVDGCFVNASFLVASADHEYFDAAVALLRSRLAGVADVDVFGPLPPYSFVTDETVQ